MKAVNAAFTTATGITVVDNVVDHSTFQNQITTYLGGTPGRRLHLVLRLSDELLRGAGPRHRHRRRVGERSRAISAARSRPRRPPHDGKVYLIPTDYYPWAVFYRKSVFADKKYTIPATWDDLKTLCAQMQKDGLIPIAFADVEGWPAMGTFDILNLRINGYQFHIDLMAGKQKWTDPKVTAVFQKWAEILPYHQDAATGRKWVDAAATLQQKKAGMYLLGLFVSGAFTNPADLADLDFFPFPYMGNQYDAEKSLDAPIDGVMISAKSPTLTANLDAAKAYMELLVEGLDPEPVLPARSGQHPGRQ